MNVIDTLIGGLLLGGLYTLFAIGLSLIFGVMRLVNIAHGDFIVLPAYIAYLVIGTTGLHPLVALLVVMPIMALIGYALQKWVLNRTMGEDDVLPPLLVTFGLAVIVQNALLAAFTGNSMRLSAGALQTSSLPLGTIQVGILPLLTLLVAVALVVVLEFIFAHTRLGRTFRATSDDLQIASTIGVRANHIYALAMAISFATIAIASVLLAVRSNFDPYSGPARLIYGFEAVIIGGLGSFYGTLAGGLVFGLAQSFGAQISPNMQILAGHLVFFIIFALRPRGLFPKAS